MTPLSQLQMAVLCQLAGRAYRHLQACYAASVDGVSLEDWRRAEQLAETGESSLRVMRNGTGQYEALRRRYQTYLGEATLELREEPEPQAADQYLHTLRQLATEPLSWGYVVAIARAKFARRSPESLTSEQLLQLIMTVQRARQRKLVGLAVESGSQDTQTPPADG
jgi:hypothetical protein